MLGGRGWNTYMLGKWHLCPFDEMNLASTKRNWPVGRGFERYHGFLGGVADPLLISWPKQIKARRVELRHQLTDATDLVPTIYDCIGVELPEVVKDFPQLPLEGGEHPLDLRERRRADPKETGFFSMPGSRAIWHKGWKAVSVHPTIAGWGDFANDPLGALPRRPRPHRDPRPRL